MKICLSNNPTRGRNSRWLLGTSIFLAGAFSLAAHVGAPPFSSKGIALPIAAVQQIVLPTTDVAAQLAFDAQGGKALPLRFAVPQPVMFSPTNSGTWEQSPEGRLWRLRVISTNATDLNFGFTTFWLPEGATLHISAESDPNYQGPYTAKDNQPDGQLWTPVVPGEAAVIELFVPAKVPQEPQLVLTQVSTGYRDFFHKWKDLATPKAEGTCNNDVICPVGDPWRNEIRSVGVYTKNGSWTCTGTMIMDVPGDFRPFFLTANHCGLSSGNAGTVVVYWNYQSATCGTHGPGSLAQNQSGATFRAAKYDCDFALIELNRAPDAGFQVYYSGWDHSGTAPSGCVGIHHPDCDVKSISFCTVPLTTINSCIGTGGVNSHWYVHWSSGVTEPGSSGSGIWDSTTHRLVGTLSGGNSACGGSDLTDCYGKFAVGWASGSSSADRLQDWLDPLGTGVSGVAGSDPLPVVVVTPAGTALVAEGCPPGNGAVDPGEVVTVNFSLQDSGTAPTTNLVATLLATNGVMAPSGPQSYGALTAGGAAIALSFTFIAIGTCGGTISPTFQLQDSSHNLGTVSFTLPLGVLVTSFTQNFDGLTVPALPSGWTSSPSGIWVTTAAQRDTLPNSAFAADVSSVSDYRLTSPLIAINSANAQLSFRHYYNTEPTYDGGVLEISINGGAFTEILSAGGSFVSGAYTGTISTSYSNPLAGRSAWTGNSGGFVTTTVTLPTAAAGGNIQLRWRLGNDSSVSATGWYVDTITVSGGYDCCPGVPPKIKVPPHRQLVLPGCDAAFSVYARGTPLLSYQWLKNGAALPSQTNVSLTLLNVQTNNFGNYSVVVTNLWGAVTSSPAVLDLDHLPVLGPATVERFAAGGVRLKPGDLLANATDPDGDGLAVANVSSPTSAGGTVTLSGGCIFYMPPPGFTNVDTFAYTASDGNCGGTAAGVATVQVKTNSFPTSKGTLERAGDGSLGLSFDGLPGWTYRIQYAETLSQPLWHDVTTQTADAYGVWGYTEWSYTNAPTRYYRTVWP